MNIDVIASQLSANNSARNEQIFTAINEELKSQLTSGSVALSHLAVESLARTLLIYAYSLSDDKRGENKKTGSIRPAWKQVVSGLNDFIQNQPEALRVCCYTQFSDDQIAQFCTLSSRKRGAGAKYFYSTFALYIVHLNDTGAFDKTYVRRMLAEDDLKKARRLGLRLQNRIDRAPTAVDAEYTATAPSFESSARFTVLHSDNDKLTRFIQYFHSGSRGNAHFVVYRSLKSDPSRILKTFLAISPTTEENDGHNSSVFFHFYRAPKEKRDHMMRFSSGKTIPLENGVYLVGGQRPWASDDKRHPFTSLKVIAFNWQDLINQHPLMPVLSMSTNYRGEIFVSRAVARITPFTHNKDIDMKAIGLSELEQDIADSYERERQFINGEVPDENGNHWIGDNAEHFLNFISTENARDDANMIIRNTNNNPRGSNGWLVPEGYVVNTGNGEEELTNAGLQSALERTLSQNKNRKDNPDANSAFEVWTSTRFAPIGNDYES